MVASVPVLIWQFGQNSFAAYFDDLPETSVAGCSVVPVEGPFAVTPGVVGVSRIVIVKPVGPFASMIRALPSSPMMSVVEGKTRAVTVSVPLADCAGAEVTQTTSNSNRAKTQNRLTSLFMVC